MPLWDTQGEFTCAGEVNLPLRQGFAFGKTLVRATRRVRLRA